jgi:rSAM/selenodomain-associated transferase 2
MRVAVVIPALDEAGRIAEAIASAAPVDAQVDAEIVVADGGSRDGTPERATACGARIVRSSKGRAQQLEAGVHASDAEVLLFLHADTRLPRGWAEAVADALADPRVVGGAFRFAFDERSPALRFVQWGARLRSEWLGLPYGDQALFVRRRVLEAIGGIPRVPLMEDLDLVAAMKRAGRVVVLPLAVTTSARRYTENGVWRTFARHAFALLAWRLGVDRARVATWVGR